MNLEFLQKEILPQRAKEIKQGKNLATAQPIYVVLDLIEGVCSGHDDFSSHRNYHGKQSVHGYIDQSLDGECIEFKTSDKRMKDPIEVTQFWTDRIIAFFLTSKGAHEYLKYQKHNMNKGYVYVFYSGYANREMNQLLQNQ
jgi:hypothetical protein